MPKTKSATNRRKKTGSATKTTTARKPARANGEAQGAVLVYCDASIVNLAAAGFVIQVGGQEIASKAELLTGGPWLDPDSVEVVAIMRSLEHLLQLGMVNQPVVVASDNRRVVEYLQSLDALKPPHLKYMVQATQDLMDQFPRVRLRWVPREMNCRTNRLVQKTTGEQIKAIEAGIATVADKRGLAFGKR